VKKPAAITVYCPFCNALGDPQPVLAPMQCEQVTTQQGARGALPPPFFRYKCARCGYQEVQERYLTERPVDKGADKPEKTEKKAKEKEKEK